MEFRKYNSIENSYQTEFIDTIIRQGFGDLTYLVQEKVHGANLSFFTDGQEIQLAKRTGIIEKGEEFFNADFVLKNYRSKVKELFAEISKQFSAKTINIFGEIFGGGYPHAEVPEIPGSKLVQRGIYYCPGNNFYAFDILIDGATYLDPEIANSLFEKFGFIYAKTLFQGSLTDCLAYPNSFKTTIPKEFSLPELDGNFCEGVVIRPIKTSFLSGGSRVLIKNKNEKWAENNKFIDKELLSKLLKDEESMSEDVSILCEEALKLITENRLNNVISKIGEINPKKNYGKILGMFNKDILEEFMKSFKFRYENLEKHEQKAINKFINKQAGRLMNKI